MRLVLLAALAAVGCNQSLFDDTVGGEVDGGVNPPGPDGGTPTECPSPCVSSAAEQFSLEQGGADGRWRYMEFRGDPEGVVYDELTLGTHAGLDAWVGSGVAPQAAITTCAGDNRSDELCAGAEDTILFAPTGNTAGSTDPSLSFAFTTAGLYRVSGSFVTPDAFAEGMQQQLVVSRNGRHDRILTQLFATSHQNQGFDFEVDALVGDHLRIDIVSNVGSGIPVGFDLFVTDGLDMNGECAIASLWDDLSNKCSAGGEGFADEGDTPTEEVSSPDGASGRTFQVGDWLRYTGSVMDYSGDFTIQFWMRIPATTEFGIGIVTDWDCAAQGGIAIARNNDMIWTAAMYRDAAADYCNTTPIPEVGFPEPTLNEWHFYRMTREGDQIRICLDGQQRAQIPLPSADADLTPINPLYLGRNVNSGSGYFEGDLANFRVFTRALPCPSVE